MTRQFRVWTLLACAVFLVATRVVTPAAKERDNDFRFCLLGDRTNGAQPEIYGRVWREVDLLHPDFVINAGDTIQGGHDGKAEAEWKEARSIWDRYARYPFFVTPGNHDIFSDSSRKLFEKETGHPPHYGFNWQNAHFTVLDTAQTADLPESELAFLKQDLEANKEKSPKLIFFHKPYWLPQVKFKNRDFPLHQIAKQYGVSYIVSGHLHQFMRMTNDGITYLIVGSSGATMRGLNAGLGFKDGFFYHFLWATVKGTNVDFTVKEVDNNGQGRMFKAEDWGDNGPAFNPNDPAAKDKPAT